MPRRTFITAEEKALPGHKPMKDRLTLLFCANASGDYKVKPLLVYHSENPRAFKKNNVQKKLLHVMWRSNTKAWVTRILFVEWMNEVFGPHPPSVEEDLLDKFKFIKVKFLPANTTPILQPMDQQVIANFKKLYTKAMFQRCFEMTEGTNLTLREFWKDHYSVYNCLNLIDKAWQGITRRTLNSAWKKLWPDCVAERDFEGFETVEKGAVEDEIVSLDMSLGLEVDTDDIEDLLTEHGQQLTTDELLELHKEQQRQVTE
ncbi:tigger transposable element-derived protein 1-like [Macrobrachium nipponense]|uniref:tigger transposable element-derived protein 1-like n=1 Tax=Macrobrachium nipponense TaxID=159736 RepID=UPI0030C7A64F